MVRGRSSALRLNTRKVVGRGGGGRVGQHRGLFRPCLPLLLPHNPRIDPPTQPQWQSIQAINPQPAASWGGGGGRASGKVWVLLMHTSFPVVCVCV